MEELGGMDIVERATKEALKVDFDNIPDELKEHNQFVDWIYEEVEGDLKKPPFDPKTGRRASVRNPRSWGTFDEARRAYETRRYAGIGYMLTGGLVAFDLDHCIIDGQLNELATWVITYLGTYAEVSPSGTGVRILISGHLPGLIRRRGNIEAYESARYVTLTGHWIAGTRKRSMTRQFTQDEINLDYVYRKIFERQQQEKSQEDSRLYRQQNIAHARVIKKALDAKNGKLFERYWYGDASLWEEAGAIHGSQSDADWQLVLYLLYWTNGNSELVDELFRMSLLMRDKWDRYTNEEGTYGQITRKKALEAYLENRKG